MDFDKTQCINVGTFRKTGAWHDSNDFLFEENSKAGWKEQQAVLPSYVASSGGKQIQSNKWLKIVRVRSLYSPYWRMLRILCAAYVLPLSSALFRMGGKWTAVTIYKY